MTETRKKDHIALSFTSVPNHQMGMDGCTYEPLLASHPNDFTAIQKNFLGFDFGMPLWVSSMTGGTEQAHKINHNLARACAEFKLGMGLGSCRPLLDKSDRFHDFNVKELMGDQPLFTNFGIAQIETLAEEGALDKLNALTHDLKADGMIVHVNPLQEWAQADEGDRFKKPPIETIHTLCEQTDFPLIVKEVGQGMGPQSLKALLQLPIAAIELAGYGGTNFHMLEQRRKLNEDALSGTPTQAFSYIGHTASQMVEYLNALEKETSNSVEIIISGGVHDPVMGHLLMKKLNMNAVVGMASSLLKHAMGDYETLRAYLEEVRECFAMAEAYLKKSKSV